MTGVDLSALSSRLTQRDDGIWVVEGSAPAALNYPDGGHGVAHRVEDDSFWFRHRSACIGEALARFPFDGPLLDVGGGNGAVSVALRDRGIAPVVVEPAAEGARNARERGLRDVVCATMEDAAFAPGSFGAAGVFDVLEHVDDYAAMLREIRRVLRPGGLLCVTVPAHRWLWSEEDDYAGHLRRYSLPRLRADLEASRFDVLYATYIFAPLIAPIFLLRSLRRRGAGLVPGSEASVRRDHQPSPLARAALDLALAPEISAIRRGWALPLGASCLVVAARRAQ